MDIVAIIPAKMTSRRLPGKNLRMLCGYPLSYYSIRAARLVKEIDHVFVSSEDKEVLRITKTYGATPLQRPVSLSSPEVTNIEVLKHFYTTLREKSEIIVLLQPTHPLRDPKDISKAIKLFQHSDADALFSVVKTDQLLGTIENNLFVPEFPMPYKKANLPVRYKNTGSFYMFRPERSFLTDRPYGKNIVPYILQRSEFEVDINYLSDFDLAEFILLNNKERFKHFFISSR